MSDTLTDAETETLNDKLINFKAKAVIDTPADTLFEVHDRRLGDILVNIEVQALIER